MMLDAEGDRFRAADVGVADDRVAAVVPSASPKTDDAVVDVGGRWLLPGLIDCHVHLTQPTDAGDPAKASARSDAAVALFTADAAARGR